MDDTDGRTDPGADRSRRKRLLRAVAVQAAGLSAAVHLLWAWPRLADPGDPRPYLFVLAGTFTALVAGATLRADEYRRLYALGAGTLTAYPLGYVAWHRGGAITAIAGDPLAIVGKAAEAVGVVAFLALYRLAPPTRVVVARRRQREGDDGPAAEAGSEDDPDGKDD